jgi:hypothetical protein
MTLAKLLPLLKSNDVVKFIGMGLEIHFDRTAKMTVATSGYVQPMNIVAPPIVPGIKTEKVEDVVVTDSLETEMESDKILFWSSPGEQQDVPLVGETPVKEEK